jgi:hypothetical protein
VSLQVPFLGEPRARLWVAQHFAVPDSVWPMRQHSLRKYKARTTLFTATELLSTVAGARGELCAT